MLIVVIAVWKFYTAEIEDVEAASAEQAPIRKSIAVIFRWMIRLAIIIISIVSTYKFLMLNGAGIVTYFRQEWNQTKTHGKEKHSADSHSLEDARPVLTAQISQNLLSEAPANPSQHNAAPKSDMVVQRGVANLKFKVDSAVVDNPPASATGSATEMKHPWENVPLPGTDSKPEKTGRVQEIVPPGVKFPESRQRILTEAVLMKMEAGDIRYAINELFARHGAWFETDEIRDAFNRFSWYQPEKGISFDEIELRFSEIEKLNLRILSERRKQAADGKPAIGRPLVSYNQYGGSVGKLRAKWKLSLGKDGNVEGTYNYPSRNPNIIYQLKGKSSKDGYLVLQEYTGARQTASLFLSKSTVNGKDNWYGEMINTDGKNFPVTISSD